MAEKDLPEILKHGVSVVTQLANDGKFVFAGVVHSLIQALRVVHNNGVASQKEVDRLVIDESKAMAMLRQVRSDLQYMLDNNRVLLPNGNECFECRDGLTALLNLVTNFLPTEPKQDA